MPRKILIMGAAGKDFHTFNTLYRDNPDFRVVAFTATQIPGIEDRTYPAELAGKLYPEGIRIYPEHLLVDLIKKFQCDEVVFAYSDVSYDYVNGKRAVVEAAGAKFSTPDPRKVMIPSTKPVIAICAVRTGSGKSQTTRRVVEILREMGRKVVVVRHPMPYGDLVAQRVQRFASIADMEKHDCTIEEMEEYEPHIMLGAVVYAGVDYEAILREAEKEADVVLWDGGNNDTPFFKPDIHICIADPHRPGHELSYYPGKENFSMAEVIVINKIDSAKAENVQSVIANARKFNPKAEIVMANSPVTADNIELIAGKKVLVVEDGPTLTHGGMKYGAGVVIANKNNATPVDPRPWAVGTIADTFKAYPGIGILLPAMGYSDQQVQDLEDTINAVECDAVIVATPIDLARLVDINKPFIRVRYELDDFSSPNIREIIARKLG
jgi:predicted GTPase